MMSINESLDITIIYSLADHLPYENALTIQPTFAWYTPPHRPRRADKRMEPTE
jgi:hypothetical protein